MYLDQHELSLIKILLDSPDSATTILSKTSASHFSLDISKELFRFVDIQLKKNLKLSPDMIRQHVEFWAGERDYGTEEFWAEVEGSGGIPENIGNHCDAINEDWYTGAVIKLLNDTAIKLKDSEEGAHTLVTKLLQNVGKLSEGLTLEISTIADLATKLEQHIDKLNDEDGDDDLFGVPGLDALRGPSQMSSELIGIMAPPKVGKSTLMNMILVNSIDKEYPLYYGSAEMNDVLTFIRAISSYMQIFASLFSSKKAMEDADIKEKLTDMLEYLKTVSNIHIELTSLSIPYVRTVTHTLYHKGVRRFMFDRIGLFEEVANARAGQESEARRQVLRGLRNIANEFKDGDVKFIFCSQVTNEVMKNYNGRASSHHIFGGIGAQANCTQLFAIYRPSQTSPTDETFEVGPFKGVSTRIKKLSSQGEPLVYYPMEVYTALNNNGPNGSGLFVFDAMTYTVHDTDHPHHLKDFGGDRILDENKILLFKKGEGSFDPSYFQATDYNESDWDKDEDSTPAKTWKGDTID